MNRNKEKKEMNRKVGIAIIIILSMFLLSGCMSASFSGNYIVREGRTLRGDLFVTSGTVTLEANSQVTGSIYMTSGVLRMGKNSEVGKDVVMTSGDIIMEDGAVIHGDLVLTSSDADVRQAPGATVEGNVSYDIAPFAIGFGLRVLLLCCVLPVIILLVVILLLGRWIGRRSKPKETVVPAPVTAPVPIPAPAETEEFKSMLQNLKNMLDEGLISQEDYEAKKADILSKM